MKIAVFQRIKKGLKQGSEMIGTVEVDIDLEDLARVSDWKRKVRAAVSKKHATPIEAVNALAQPHKGCHISVTLGVAPRGFGRAMKRPTSRGGRPIESPEKRRTLPSLIRR